ncbi:MAG: DUF1343 domain-containing protein [Melioribacteraceae bacterium]|nr:DUF1343 domain-containing protein [Melioribacteraceae bacterium]
MRQTFIFFLLTLLGCFNSADNNKKFKLGSENLIDDQIDLLQNKRLGLIVNQTSVTSNGTHLLDTLFTKSNIEIIALFSTEHGFTGKIERGILVEDSQFNNEIAIFSLHGLTKKPTSQMLENIDLLLFDIQDIGARFYTYISTMKLAMEAAAENDKKFVVLDRPNPIGSNIEGMIIQDKHQSFLGIDSLSVTHGMTIGELALYFNRKINCDLKIIPISNWDRNTSYEKLDLIWQPTSPNIPTLETAKIYPGICLLEATNISEGRGTENPFLQFGAPFIDADQLLAKLNQFDIPGVELSKIEFTPISIPGMAAKPKYQDEICAGIKATIVDFNTFRPVKFGVILLKTLYNLYPSEVKIRRTNLRNLFGSDLLSDYLENKISEQNFWEVMIKSETEFYKIRKPYLLY